MQPRAGLLKTIVVIVGEFLLVALALFAMDGLAHLRLSVGQFLVGWGGWVAVLLLGRALRGKSRVPESGVALLEMLAPGFGLNELEGRGPGGFTVAQTLYAIGLVALLVRAWRRWTKWQEGRGLDVAAEGSRVLAVGVAAAAVTLPLFVDRLVGGTDARWYAYSLEDFIGQLRAGVFPVLVSQGELAWNGGVHPFRSAPVFMNVAGLWDLLTFRSLDTCALQHLAAITSAFASGLGMYAAGVALAPRHRWEALGIALLYLAAPASLEVLYGADAYMTWMVLPALPLVFYGNARALLAADGRGYAPMAAGLALAWMSHPPIALLATVASGLLQGGLLLCGEAPAVRLRAAAGGVLLFAALGAFYFYGMSELPPHQKNVSMKEDALQFAGAVLWLAGFTGALLRRRGMAWLLLLAPGGWLLWTVRVPWFWWMGATSLLALVVAGLAQWRRWFDPAEHALGILLPCALAAAAATQAWLGPTHPARDLFRLQELAATSRHAPDYFLPVSRMADQPGDWQPGLGLWVAVALLAGGFFRARPLATKLWFVVALLPLFVLVRVPWLSEFLVGYAPRWFAAISGLTLPLRLMPTLAALLAVGWFLWLATRPAGGRFSRIWPVLILAASVAWGGHEAARIVPNGYRATATRSHTEKQFRPENAVLERFAYDLLPIPMYYSNGKTDWRLEAHALDEAKHLRIGPDVTALRMEETHRTELRLLCQPYSPPAPAWLQLGATLTLAPGEHVLLRFEFDARHNYSGYLFMISPHGYREYALPASGAIYAFGANATNSRVVSLWNSGSTPERYEFSFRRDAGCDLPSDGSWFATVFVSHYDPARALVRVDSLVPYRVTAAMSWPGFIETSRIWLPGYEATVDGQPAAVTVSPQWLAMVPVPPGLHTVELRYVGTTALRCAWWVSAVSWLGMLGFWLWRWRRHT